MATRRPGPRGILLVLLDVVGATEQLEIGEVGLASVNPVSLVMHVAPLGPAIAALASAPTVSNREGAALRRGGGAHRPAHFEWNRVASDYEPGDFSITENTTSRLGSDRAGLGELASFSRTPHQGVEIDDQGGMRAMAAYHTGIGSQILATNLHQGIGASSRGGTQIA